MVHHIQHYHNRYTKPNTTRKERKLLKDLRDITELVKFPADKGTASVLENEANYVNKEQDQITLMYVKECTKSEKSNYSTCSDKVKVVSHEVLDA